MEDKCPICGGPVLCLSGEPAHPYNWYCVNDTDCGWIGWESESKAKKPIDWEDVARKRGERLEIIFRWLELQPCTIIDGVRVNFLWVFHEAHPEAVGWFDEEGKVKCT